MTIQRFMKVYELQSVTVDERTAPVDGACCICHERSKVRLCVGEPEVQHIDGREYFLACDRCTQGCDVDDVSTELLREIGRHQ